MIGTSTERIYSLRLTSCWLATSPSCDVTIPQPWRVVDLSAAQTRTPQDWEARSSGLLKLLRETLLRQHDSVRVRACGWVCGLAVMDVTEFGERIGGDTRITILAETGFFQSSMAIADHTQRLRRATQ